MFLYLTADKVGIETGGGKVTQEEYEFLCSLGETNLVSRDQLEIPGTEHFQEPWKWDKIAYHQFGNKIKLAHVYSGTFGDSVQKLKDNGAKVVYTIAAHDRFISRREHEKLGLPFPYPHLVEEPIWRRYIAGYRAADVVICPSQHSANIVSEYGGVRVVKIIPHGVDIPSQSYVIPEPPKTFVVGYLGSLGSDKGIVYLLQAWRKLAYKDATLVIAGRDSTSDWAKQLVAQYGGGNIQLLGWVKEPATFYQKISLYIQPSCTEGWGLEVTEALANGRQALVSKGAGAADAVPEKWRFESCDVDDLVGAIDNVKVKGWSHWRTEGDLARQHITPKYSWSKVREMYQKVWKELL